MDRLPAGRRPRGRQDRAVVAMASPTAPYVSGRSATRIGPLPRIGPGDEPVVAALEGGDEVEGVRLAEEGDGRTEHPVDVAATGGEGGELGQDPQVQPMAGPLRGEVRAHERGDRAALGAVAAAAAGQVAGEAPRSVPWTRDEGRPAAPGPPSARRAPAAVGGHAGRLGGGEESLEIAHPIAPIAARIDPVVAQPALIAPRADRVRVDAQDPGGLGHGQGRVAGARREACGHLGPCWRKCEVDGADTREPHTSFQ